MPRRIQRKRTKGWRMPEGAIYVGRPSAWGNPFLIADVLRRFPSLTVDQGAGFVVSEFRDLIACVERGLAYEDSVPDQRRGRPRVARRFTYSSIAEIRADLRGHDLACWCPLDQPCHADVLLELANA